MEFSTLLAAVVPPLIVIGYICFKDKAQPEPSKMLLKAFGLGLLTGPASLLISYPLGWLGFYDSEPTTTFGYFLEALFGAAVPEELVKLAALWLVVRKNKDFDEYFDGIVYCVCVGMGFASIENILYLFGAGDNWLQTGIIRGLLTVPGHYADSALMGSFFTLAWFGSENVTRNKIFTILIPVVVHAAYDFLVFTISSMSGSDETSWLACLLLLFFLVAFIWLQRRVSKKLKTHLAADLGQE